MNLETLINSLPGYAADLQVNFANLMRQSELTDAQAWGTLLASSIACRNAALLEAVAADAAQHLDAAAQNGAKTAAAIMAMNNIYFRFIHLTANSHYAAIRSRLRRNGTRTHGANPVDFELWCVAVSAIHGCGACIDAHEQALRERGVSEETVAAAVRIASVVHAIAVTLEGEAAPGPAAVPA